MKTKKINALTNRELKQEYKTHFNKVELKEFTPKDALIFYQLEEEIIKRGGKIINRTDVIF